MIVGTLGTVRREAPELQPLLGAGMGLKPYPSRTPCFPFTPAEQVMQQLGHLEAGLSAEADGCAAVVIDSLGDYGIAAVRSALSIPVVGAGEAGMRLAGQGGRPFAIVTVWPRSLNYIPQDRLRAYGLEALCTEVVNVGTEGDLGEIAGQTGYLARVHDADQPILGAVCAAAAAAVSRGAEAVLLGCTCMSPMAARVAGACDFPVINPLGAAVAQAVLQLQQGGLAAGGQALRLRSRDMVRRMVDAVADGQREDCPVCVVAQSA